MILVVYKVMDHGDLADGMLHLSTSIYLFTSLWSPVYRCFCSERCKWVARRAFARSKVCWKTQWSISAWFGAEINTGCIQQTVSNSNCRRPVSRSALRLWLEWDGLQGPSYPALLLPGLKPVRHRWVIWRCLEGWQYARRVNRKIWLQEGVVIRSRSGQDAEARI